MTDEFGQWMMTWFFMQRVYCIYYAILHLNICIDDNAGYTRMIHQSLSENSKMHKNSKLRNFSTNWHIFGWRHNWRCTFGIYSI